MRLILISHGNFAEGALQAASMIVGAWDGISAVGLMPEDGLESMARKIEDDITEHNAAGEEILILSDLFVGSPFSSVALLMGKYKLQHITGMNLAMVIEAINGIQAGLDMKSVTKACMNSMKESVVDVNALLDAAE